MAPELDSQIQPLFKELREAILNQAYRVTSYASSDLSTDAMQRIQSALEKILLPLISIEDIEIQNFALDALSYICSDSSEAFFIERLYTADLHQNENLLYRVGNFFVNLYRIRGVDLYTAAQRHANTYVRLLLINKSGLSGKNISLNEIEKFLHDDLKAVRYQALHLLTDYPENRYVSIYLQLLKDVDVYDFWENICEALIEVGIPDDAFEVLLKSYLIAIETEQEYGLYEVSGAILNTLLICNRDLTIDTFLKFLKSSDQTLKSKAITAFEYMGPKELSEDLFHQLDLTHSKKEPDISEDALISEHDVRGDLSFHLAFNDASEGVRYEAILGMIENEDPFLDANFMRILSDSSYLNRILGLKYISENRPMQKMAYVVDSLFDAYSESLFEQITKPKHHEEKSDLQLTDV